jgi:preprotein translocase subunit SecG
MSVMLTLILVVQLLSALAMIQHGKGADMGAAFGSSGSGSLFGATGGANFMSRTTAVLAFVFFACTLSLAYFGNLTPASSGSVLDGASVSAPVDASPAAQIPVNTPAPASDNSVPPATPKK